MEKGRFGCIGAGNMAGAMVRGISAFDPSMRGKVTVYDTDTAKCVDLAEETGCTIAESVEALTETVEFLVLAVKPYVYEPVLSAIRPVLSADQTVVSITPSFSLAWLADRVPEGVHVIRLMPNTPSLVGAGMISMTPAVGVPEEVSSFLKKRLETFSVVEMVPESLIPAVIGVSGSAPAYVFQFIEAMADGAVAEGMPRETAYRFAAQTVLGAAKMVMDTGRHPGELKDMVTSPGGTTIEAVAHLEEKGLRAAVIGAVRAAAEKTRAMGD